MDGRLLPWEISGTYLESCNCEVICPCRRVGGRQGGRSTKGVCLGALSWQVEEGHAGAVDLDGLRAVLALRYNDDEEGSPWEYHLYLDDRGDEQQREALGGILAGRLGGTPAEQFPWVFKPSQLLGVRPAPIEIDHSPTHGWFRAGRDVSVRVGAAVADQEAVTCVIPGHDRAGQELYGETIDVDSKHLAFHFEGRCGYWSTFEYSSA